MNTTTAHMRFTIQNGMFTLDRTYKYSIRVWRKHGVVVIDEIEIHKGFTTDGASVPRLFWWLLSPYNPHYLQECTVHDFLCNQRTFRRANYWFNVLLKQNLYIPAYQRWLLIAGVRLWHWLLYKRADYACKAVPRWYIRLFLQEV